MVREIEPMNEQKTKCSCLVEHEVRSVEIHASEQKSVEVKRIILHSITLTEKVTDPEIMLVTWLL